MINLTIGSFLNDLESLSPLTYDFEANTIVMLIYMSLLKKNTNLSISKQSSPEEKLEYFSILLDNKIAYLESKLNISQDYIHEYMLAMKMPKSTKDEIKMFEKTIEDANIRKIRAYINIIHEIQSVLSSYDEVKDCYQDQYLLANEIAIKNLNNIIIYTFKEIKAKASYIDDEDVAYEVLSLIKKINL